MINSKTLILDKTKVEQKINRIAYQIYENHPTEKTIFIVGINENGYKLAERIAKQLEILSPIKVELIRISMNKNNPLNNNFEIPLANDKFDKKVVVLVDDVINSGKTMMYAISRLMEAKIKTLRTIVLIDRDHKNFPIKIDYVGLSLATTLQEHISVEFGGAEEGVYLM